MVRPCWITVDGEIIHCPNANDHQHEAAKRFTDSANPEKTAEDIGWIKITGYCEPPRVHCTKEPNQPQIDAMFRAWPRDYGILTNVIFDCLHPYDAA